MSAQTASLQHEFFQSGKTRGFNARIEALERLEKALEASVEKILTALFEDLGKPPLEAYASEIGILLAEIRLAKKNLKRWHQAQPLKTNLLHWPSKAKRVAYPYGRVLILSPWNYPVYLTLAPLVGALASGNVVTLKPSERMPHVCAALQSLIQEIFPPEWVALEQGGPEDAQALLKEQWDLVFFTGSTRAGREIRKSLADRDIPLVLELGGKNPVIMGPHTHMKAAARRIWWGKTFNAGQTCVAPDFACIHHSRLDEFIEESVHYLNRALPEPWSDMARLLDLKSLQRVTHYFTCGKVLLGGESNSNTLKLAATLLKVTDWNSPPLQEEIFAPLLPIVSYQKLEDILPNLQSLPEPLALYHFGLSKAEKEILKQSIRSGSCVEEGVFTQLVNPHLPFGGVGASGNGRYRGAASADTFSYWRTEASRHPTLEIPAAYPPYKHSWQILARAGRWLFGA